ncbi:hypothetical protein [Autumnicola musiva]|uniref:DUF4467 domain-containing protein n=1 Tax=Autumnicola musiva TaxID=3075589 RepID=A0ABU3D265_9FLAO|nr:hypothetical protein [Zunongwangia sp. F117]MDT0675628.1 hypothetical protein [Zunongwangia sp. F117]
MIKYTCVAIIVAILLTSCYSTKAPAIKIGMSVEEFKKLAKYEQLVAMDQESCVYRVIYGIGANRAGYYYFEDNKFVRMDSEEDHEDYRISIDRR